MPRKRPDRRSGRDNVHTTISLAPQRPHESAKLYLRNLGGGRTQLTTDTRFGQKDRRTGPEDRRVRESGVARRMADGGMGQESYTEVTLPGGRKIVERRRNRGRRSTDQ